MTTLTRMTGERFTTVRQDLVTALLSLWLMAGLMLDGWAHTTRGGVESFFTPWHAAFYSGFLASAAWVLFLVRGRRFGPMGPVATGIPVGYRLALSGLVIFGVGGVLDLIWHQVFGIEVEIDALVSPTHMILLLGAMLVVATPFRASWHRPTPRTSKWSWVAPAVISAGLSALLAQFFVFYASGWQAPTFRDPWQPGGDDFLVAYSVLSLVTSTLIFMFAWLLLLVRWNPPFGSFAAVLAIVGLGLQGVHGFEHPGELLGAVVAGLLVDMLDRRLQATSDRTPQVRAWSFLAPLVVWGVHAVYLSLVGDFGWPPVLWGAIVLQGFVGLGLSLLVLPPTLPRSYSEGSS
jgi:hypothetical protein